MQISPKPDWTKDQIDETCAQLRRRLQDIADAAVAVGVIIIDPQAYFVYC